MEIKPGHLYLTSASPCPYLPGQRERKIVARLDAEAGPRLYNQLSRVGFRRSLDFAYRPFCERCEACVAVRTRAGDFLDSRSTRRVRNLNRDLRLEQVENLATDEHFELFVRYVAGRHGDGEMAGMDWDAFRQMIELSPIAACLTEARAQDGQLLGVCLTDRLDDGLSAVYSFFAPTERRRSLGTFLVLTLIDQARAAGLPFAYLGYQISDCRKMAYKARFRPLEAFHPGGGWLEWTP